MKFAPPAFTGTRRKTLLGLAMGMAVCALSGLHDTVHAQSGSGDPVRLVVAYAVGGSIDLAARRLSDSLAAELGRPVIVENRVGANGVVATDYVARSNPDGNTILFTTLNAHAGNASAYKSLSYDTLNDFQAVAVLSIVPLALVAHPSMPANTISDLVQLAKTKPGKLNYASFGVGGLAHLAAVQLNLIAGTEMTHVPYKGGGPAMADVVGGHVDMYFSGAGSALPHVKGGKLKVLGVSSKERVPSLPDVPTISETPGFEDFEAVVAPIMLVPAKTPPEVVEGLHAATLKVTQTEKYRQQLLSAGEGEPRATTPAESMDMLEKEVKHQAVLFKAAGISPE